MAIEVRCPRCGEAEDIRGTRDGDLVALSCSPCGFEWTRDPSPRCRTCGGDDLHPAIAAIVEKGRGTELSIVGTRVEYMCETCQADTLARYFKNRPNPLMPIDLPNAT